MFKTESRPSNSDPCFVATVIPKSAWVPDDQAPACRSCSVDFGLYTRRHHCRLCGEVYCAECCDISLSIKPDVKSKTLSERSCWSCLFKLNQTQLPYPTFDYFINIRNTRSYYRTWTPPQGAAVKGLLLVIHGLNDHSGRFSPWASYMTQRGFVMSALDLPGHGRCRKGSATYFDSNEDLLNDLTLFTQLQKTMWARVPVFIFGFGFGALVVVKMVIEAPSNCFNGVIIMSPSLSIPDGTVGSATVGLATMAGTVVPGMGLERLPLTTLCHDPEVVTAYMQDPLVSLSPVPARVGSQLMKLMAEVRKAAEVLCSPVLILYGSSDILTQKQAIEPWFTALPSDDKTLIRCSEWFHELLNEPKKELVYADIWQWIKERCKGRVAGVAESRVIYERPT